MSEKKLIYSIGIVGPQGSGKTYLAMQWALQMPRVIIFDPLHNSEWPGVTVMMNPREAVRQTVGRNWKVHYCASDINEKRSGGKSVPGLDRMASIAWARENCTLIIEEAHLVCSPWTCPPYFLKLILVGRNHRVNFVWISHSFPGIHRRLSGNTTKLVFFRTREPLELKAIADRCGSEVSQKVSELRRNADGVAPQRLEFLTGTGDYQII